MELTGLIAFQNFSGKFNTVLDIEIRGSAGHRLLNTNKMVIKSKGEGKCFDDIQLQKGLLPQTYLAMQAGCPGEG